VSMARLVVVSDLFPAPDRPCIIQHGSILPLDSPSWNPGSVLSMAQGVGSPHEVRRSSWPTSRVVFAHHGRIGTACSKQWHTGPVALGATEAGTPNRRQGQAETEERSNTTGLWANVRAAVRIGPPRPACSREVARGFGCRPAEQGHPRDSG
jgi:hypothetical protein